MDLLKVTSNKKYILNKVVANLSPIFYGYKEIKPKYNKKSHWVEPKKYF